MGYIEGLLGGFTGRKREVETENLRLAEQANLREAKIYETLINSPDEETRSLAITGLLTSAQAPRRKGGLRGWLGEMEQNPALARIRDLVTIPVEDTSGAGGAPTAPAPQPGTVSAQPAQGLAQSATAATQVGAPPLRSIEPATREEASAIAPTLEPFTDEQVTVGIEGARPAGGGGAPGVASPTALLSGQAPTPAAAASQPPGAPPAGPRMRTREMFLSPEETIKRRYSAQEEGEIFGVAGAYEKAFIAQGMPPADAKKRALDLAIEERRRARGVGAGTGMQSIAGEMPDGKPAFGVFDRALGKYLDPNTQKPLEGFRPRTTTGSTSLGADRESIAREMFGKPAAQLTTAQMAQVNDRVLSFSGEKAGSVTTGRGEASANIPLSTQQRYQATTDLAKQWTTEREAGRLMENQYKLMQTGVSRYEADPIGGSQAVLVTFQKILDPTSVVRESEYARSPSGLAILDRMQGLYEKYSAGGAGVPKPVLEGMVETARQFLETLKGSSNATRQRIQDTATSYEIDPRLVLGPDMPASTVGAPPPAAGPTTAPTPQTVGAPPSVAAAPATAPAPAPAAGGKPAPAAAVKPAGGKPAAGPGPEWTMVDGVLHFQGKPY